MVGFLKSFFFVFLLFFSYSVLGYLLEIVFCTVKERKIVVNRGFLLGPYLPIYGVGAIISAFFLNRYQEDFVALFTMSAVICSLIEYFTSLILEKIFKIRWWDYSNNKFSVNGRICLFNSILFGLAGIIIVKLVNPFFLHLLRKLSSFWLLLLGSIFFVIFMVDVILSIATMVQLKLNSNMFMKKDATEEVKAKIKEALGRRTFFISRVLRAFPRINFINDKKVKEFNDYIEHLKEERKALKKKRKSQKKQ